MGARTHRAARPRKASAGAVWHRDACAGRTRGTAMHPATPTVGVVCGGGCTATGNTCFLALHPGPTALPEQSPCLLAPAPLTSIPCVVVNRWICIHRQERDARQQASQTVLAYVKLCVG